MKNTLISAVVLTFVLISSPLVQAAKDGEHHPNFFQQLNLSDAQKQQIATIKKSGVDKKEKKQEILAVLTPDQKSQLKALKKEWKASHSASGAPTTATNPTTPAPTTSGQVTPLPGVPVSQ